MKSQVGTATNEHGGIRKIPYVFTEQGVAMLATVIRTDIAAKVSINIMRAFVHMRHYIKYNEQLLPRKYLLLEEKVDKNTKRIEELFNKFDHRVITKNSIFFKGDIYDAYSVLLEIFDIAKMEYDVILTFKSEVTGKDYVVYTDNSKDEEGNVRVFASIYKMNDKGGELLPIKTDKEWKVIETILESIQEEGKKTGE